VTNNNFSAKGINRRSWEEKWRAARSSNPEVVVEPPRTTKNKGSSDTETMQQMFPGSPIHDGILTNTMINDQKTTLLSRGVVDDGGHTFGKVDRSFGGTPGPVDLTFDKMSLLDISQHYFISSSFKSEVRAYVPRPLQTLNNIAAEFCTYQEGLLFFNNQTVATLTFATAFSSVPYVVLTADPTVDNQDNINVFGLTTPTTTGFLIGTSAPFTGYVRYRAAACTTNVWPKTFSSAYTSSMLVYAGEIELSNQNSFSANFTFPVLPAGNVTFLSTMYDAYYNNTANTATTVQNIVPLTLTTFQADCTTSEYATVKIHFIAFKNT